MKRFLLTYWIGLLFFFALFYWELSPISFTINETQTNFTTFLTSLLFNEHMIQEHHIIINNYYSLVIEKACNGLIPYLFFVSSVVAFPSTLPHKLKWIVLGYIIISIVNVFRIWLVTQFVLREQSNFSLAHDYIGNALLIVTGLGLFILFIKTRKRKKSRKKE